MGSSSSALDPMIISFKLPSDPCLRCACAGTFSITSTSFRRFISKGPGAIVFILWRNPPLDGVLGLTGAYIGSAAVSCPLYPRACCGFSRDWFCGVGKVGKGESKFEVKNSGDEGILNNGAVVLRRGCL
jgi:hypothetical protein